MSIQAADTFALPTVCDKRIQGEQGGRLERESTHTGNINTYINHTVFHEYSEMTDFFHFR
jgi:hypothetical protein